MQDREILATIERLVEEEDRLHEEAGPETTAEVRAELRTVEEQLDQCWDLLRQRRARRQAGQDPDAVQARDINTVEHYQQ